MIRRIDEISEEQELETIVRGILPEGKYRDIKIITGGDGTRRAKFSAKWGMNGGSRPVRIKVDKRVEQPRKKRSREKGYNTANDATFLSGLPYNDAWDHGIIPILDYEVRNGVVVSVEPEFTEGQALGDFFDGKKITSQEFNQVISGITKAVKYAHDNGFYHRDLNDKNIMVRKNGKGLETKLTDWEFAVSKTKVRDAPFTSSGSRSLRDPLLETQPYGDQSEIYQIAMNAISLFSKEALSWNESEELKDPVKRKDAIRKALYQMPKNIRKRHGAWIEKSLSLDSEERFTSFDEFSDAIYSAVKPTLWERVKSKKDVAGLSALAGGVLALAFGSGIWYHDARMKERVHQQALEEARVPRVEAAWNGRGLEVYNDHIKFDVMVTGFQGHSDKHQWYPYNNQFLRVEPGQDLDFLAKVSAFIGNEKSRLGAFVDFNGQFYIEGERFEDGSVANEFYVNNENPDEAARDYGPHGYWNPSRTEFKIPSKLKDGVYILAAELFAPTEERRTSKYRYYGERSNVANNWYEAKIRFENPGGVISRRRIPLIVGKPEVATELYELGLTWNEENWGVRNLGEPILPYMYTCAKHAAHYRAEVLGTNFNRFVNKIGLGLPIPSGESIERDFYFQTRDSSGRLIGFTGVPIQSRKVWNEDSVRRGLLAQQYMWGLDTTFNSDFARKLVEYKEKLPYQIDLPKEEK